MTYWHGLYRKDHFAVAAYRLLPSNSCFIVANFAVVALQQDYMPQCFPNLFFLILYNTLASIADTKQLLQS
jgi:hypothetical protein